MAAPTSSVIIPTLNAAAALPELLGALDRGSLKPLEIIIVDSGSQDETVAIAREAGCEIAEIRKEHFQHGRARNMGAALASGEILVFMTQDVVPLNPDFLANLVQPIIESNAKASTARQVAPPGASPLEKYTREANYPEESFIRSAEDVERLGVMAYFFSNAASAVDRSVFEELGGFSEEVIVNEDMHFCARLLQAGYRVAYQADAIVYHSHDYSLIEQFQRNFDIGVFFTQTSDVLDDVSPRGRGIRFAVGQIRYLLESGGWYWIPRAVTESLLKYIGFSLGIRNLGLPRSLCRAFSRQKAYWERDPGR